MLANFFSKNNHIKLHCVVCLFLVFFSQQNFAQNASVLENITENEGLPSNYVFNANEDQNGVIWLGTDKGLTTFQDGKWISLDVDNGMPGNYINKAIADGKNGLLLYMSERGLYYFDTNKKIILNRYSEIRNGIFLDFKKSTLNYDYIIIHLIDQKKNQDRYLAFNRNNIYKLSELEVFNNQLYLKENNKKQVLENLESFKHPQKISFDNYTLEPVSKGVLRTYNSGKTDTITEKKGLANNFVNHILKTKNNDVIISTLGGGISVLRKNIAKTIFNNENINVRNITYYKGKTYILADGFLYIINKEKIESKIFIKKDALTFFIDNDNFYLGSFSGLETYQLSNNRLKLLNVYPITAGISKIYKENDKIIFTTYGAGIFIKQGNTVKNINNRPFNNIENFQKIHNGFAMISYESGLTLLDENFNFLNHIDKDDGIVSNFVTDIFSVDDTLYIGTRKGISTFYDKISVKNFTSENGFVGNITRNIFKDNQNRIWILTDKCLLLKVQNILKPIASLRILENAQDLILKGEYSAENNNLTIVTKNKILEIDLNKIVTNKQVATTKLLKALENGNSIDISDRIYIEDHNKNTTFVFSSVDKNMLGKTTLYYKVNDDVWKPFKEPRTLKFSHLDQGVYKLQVKSVNEDGYEAMMPNVIEFKVLGPFYIRWWFILIIATVVGFFIYNYVNEINKKKYIKRLNQLRVKHQLENERKRISRDLHDNIGAYVTSLISKIDKLKTANPRFENPSEVSCDDVRLDAEHILALLRQTIWVLGNKETNLIALYDNFKSYARKFLQTDHIKIIFEENIDNNRKFDSTTGSGIFRIMQEALQNIYKHAHATKVEVNIISQDKIIIYIKDNGKGFKQDDLKEGFGLQNMRERARELGFKFNIYSDSTGTTLELYEF